MDLLNNDPLGDPEIEKLLAEGARIIEETKKQIMEDEIEASRYSLLDIWEEYHDFYTEIIHEDIIPFPGRPPEEPIPDFPSIKPPEPMVYHNQDMPKPRIQELNPVRNTFQRMPNIPKPRFSNPGIGRGSSSSNNSSESRDSSENQLKWCPEEEDYRSIQFCEESGCPYWDATDCKHPFWDVGSEEDGNEK